MIKQIMLLLCAILLPLACLAQQPVERDSKQDNCSAENEVSQQDVIYRSVQQMPEYPGGQDALMDYLAQEIQYPKAAIERNVQGKVIVAFVVEKDGSVSNVKVVRSVDPDLDAEAVRVCKTMAGFKPGRQDDQIVRVWYTLPISFKLRQNSLYQRGSRNAH